MFPIACYCCVEWERQMRRHEYKRICRRLDHDPFDLDAQRSIDEWVVSIDSITLGDREALMQAILVVIEACGGQSEEHQAVRAALLEVFCAVRRRDPAAASLLRQLPGRGLTDHRSRDVAHAGTCRLWGSPRGSTGFECGRPCNPAELNKEEPPRRAARSLLRM